MNLREVMWSLSPVESSVSSFLEQEFAEHFRSIIFFNSFSESGRYCQHFINQESEA